MTPIIEPEVIFGSDVVVVASQSPVEPRCRNCRWFNPAKRESDGRIFGVCGSTVLRMDFAGPIGDCFVSEGFGCIHFQPKDANE